MKKILAVTSSQVCVTQEADRSVIGPSDIVYYAQLTFHESQFPDLEAILGVFELCT